MDWFERRRRYHGVQHRLEGNVAQLFVFRPGDAATGEAPAAAAACALALPLARDWDVFGDPHPRQSLGRVPLAAVRGTDRPGDPSVPLCGRNRHSRDRAGLAPARTSTTRTGPSPASASGPTGCAWTLGEGRVDSLDPVRDRGPYPAPVPVSWAMGGNPTSGSPWSSRKRSAWPGPRPWGGHSGYPDGAIDQNFVELPEGRKLLFTRIRSPKHTAPRVAGRAAEFRGTPVGQRHRATLRGCYGQPAAMKGENTVLLDLPDGGHGMLFVQAGRRRHGLWPIPRRNAWHRFAGRLLDSRRSSRWLRKDDVPLDNVPRSPHRRHGVHRISAVRQR